MVQLLWWAIFLVPTLVALVWALWQAHPADPGDAFHSMAEHRRFVRALAPDGSPDGRAGRSGPVRSGPHGDPVGPGVDPDVGRSASPDLRPEE